MKAQSAVLPGHPSLAFERMLFFSDAIFAIAITLLVIEIRLPVIQGQFTESALGYALLGILPKITGFLISFLLIGQTWIEHHRLCTFIGNYDPGLLWKNLLLLLFVAFLPFATTLVSEYYFSRVAISMYAFSFAGLGLAKTFFWRHAVKAHLLTGDADPMQVKSIGRRVWATPITSIAVIIATACGIPYAYVGFGAIPLVASILGRSIAGVDPANTRRR